MGILVNCSLYFPAMEESSLLHTAGAFPCLVLSLSDDKASTISFGTLIIKQQREQPYEVSPMSI